MLTTLTLLLIAIVVIGLAAHLAAVAWALMHARHSVTRIANALEEVARQTTPLEGKLVTINGALSALAGGLDTADRHLGRAARVFRL
jgi:endonuclease/exonuclease/phosphatase (EEP) superfamily protein YafD